MNHVELNLKFRTGPRKTARALSAALDRYIQSNHLTTSGDTSDEDTDPQVKLTQTLVYGESGHDHLSSDSKSALETSEQADHKSSLHTSTNQEESLSRKGSGDRDDTRNSQSTTDKKYLLVDDNQINLKVK